VLAAGQLGPCQQPWRSETDEHTTRSSSICNALTDSLRAGIRPGSALLHLFRTSASCSDRLSRGQVGSETPRADIEAEYRCGKAGETISIVADALAVVLFLQQRCRVFIAVVILDIGSIVAACLGIPAVLSSANRYAGDVSPRHKRWRASDLIVLGLTILVLCVPSRRSRSVRVHVC